MSIRGYIVTLAVGLGLMVLVGGLWTPRPSDWQAVDVAWVEVSADGSAWFTDTASETYRVGSASQAQRCLPHTRIEVRYVSERLTYWRTVTDVRAAHAGGQVRGGSLVPLTAES